MNSVTPFSGPRALPPAPPSRPPELALLPWLLVVILVVIGLCVIGHDAEARYADLHAAPTPCDLAPSHPCALLTSKGTQLLVYGGDGGYVLTTPVATAKGETP